MYINSVSNSVPTSEPKSKKAASSKSGTFASELESVFGLDAVEITNPDREHREHNAKDETNKQPEQKETESRTDRLVERIEIDIKV